MLTIVVSMLLEALYSYNRATFAGVVVTSEPSININNSSFSENAAEIHGGVIITYNDFFSINGTIFY